ncbi:hypothetical protein [Sphingobacterium tabacisoli]|uniref:Phage protein n=1 Tax=Sphingobacterium tabacisoli TaxID=2044855 RepID=A0ABW5L3J1_9SPHI|nr:hypothetical protein [Sphingobacterium tabacisoli]
MNESLIQRDSDWRYQLSELIDEKLLEQVNSMSRPELIEWLAWNDRNGLFLDEDAIAEGYPPLTEQEARMCVYGVIMRDEPEWDSYMGEVYLRDLDLAVDVSR